MIGNAQLVESSRTSAAATTVPDKVLQLDGATGYAEMPALTLNGNA